jgi:hypothetical protein
VSTSAQLQDALLNASSQSSPYTIRIVASATPYQLLTDTYFEVPENTKIIGGYTAGCGSHADNAASTVIDSGGYRFKLYSWKGDNNYLEIDGLTFRHGSFFFLWAGEEGVFSDDPGNVMLHDVRISDFADAFVGWINGVAQLVNVQFDHLHPANEELCAVRFGSIDDVSMTANFVTADLSQGKNFCVETSFNGGAVSARIDNSIIWGSDNIGSSRIFGVDPENNDSPLELSMHNTLSHGFAGYGTLAQNVAPIEANPHWTNPTAGNYHLADAASPAVNSGNANAGLGTPYYDITHNLRSVGSRPDRGAYESPFDNSTVLTVTSSGDDANTSGTLRWAITNANMFGGAHTVAFNLPSCPTVISLATPLPNVLSAITVDGYTQPGATPASDNDSAFDANLCVLIKPSTSAAVAFKVPSTAQGGINASLTLRGLGIGGFSQDVLLLGGWDHVVVGNQFGGTANGVALGTSQNAITIGVDADSFVIGNFDAASRNVIGGAQSSGITVQSTIASDTDHCQIVNNWIGLAPDGLTALPNFTGLNLAGSGCSIYGNRIAGNDSTQLWINGGHDNVIQHNIIGYNLWANGLPNNSGIGILVGGDNNVIGGSAGGQAPGSLLTNYVGNMNAGGIVVDSGVGNSIRFNFITANNHGDAMDIDLGGDGPTPNGHGGTGPNNWQNFAVIDQLVYLDYPPIGNVNSPATISAHLNGAPGIYRVDAYYGESCSATTGRGHAEIYLGDIEVTIPNGATIAAFTLPISLPGDLNTFGISMTATSVADGTSEMGACFLVGNGLNDAIFRSGFGTGADY